MTDYLRTHRLTITQFSKISGINSGTLSRILSGSKPISMEQLERITFAMGLEESHFFSSYIDECFSFSAPNWRRLRPFLLRCAELNRLDCIEQVVDNLLDNLAYAPSLFEVAEELFEQKKYEAAALLYKGVSASEKYQHSERLALCQYRLFVTTLGGDLDANLEAAILFEAYVDRLDELDQLEALRRLAHVFGAAHKWKKVEQLARKLHKIATIQYKYEVNSGAGNQGERRPKKPVYYYIFYALLTLSVVCEECGQYEQAMHYAALYADSSWVREDTEESKQIIRQFQEWAVANTYIYRLLAGDMKMLTEYVNYLNCHEEEVFTGLCSIVQAANLYGHNIDDILERFSSFVPYSIHQSEFGGYSKPIIMDQTAQFLSDLAAYQLHNNRHEGISLILQGLDLSIKINSEKNIIRCMALFEKYRGISEDKEKEKFKSLVNEVERLNEEKNNFFVSSI
ncbi:transcriptional regulator [Paenibacillus sp. CAA11]|nr:transcriptional regulator [Paenibacillus sp. CAA11]